MYKYILIVFLILPFVGQSQEVNDVRATKILDNLSKAYKNASSIQSDFTLTIQLPEMEPEVQNGNLKQTGKKFHVNLDQNEVISNGETVYIIMKDQNIAQLHNTDILNSKGNMMNPFSMFDIHKSGEYIYSIMGTEKINDKSYTVIELKPTDRYSEYSKVRLTVDESSNTPNYIKVFVKDGSQYTLQIDNIDLDNTVNNQEFEFDKESFPNLIIEDLRI